jgi:predicted PurR-regulated permease PerM
MMERTMSPLDESRPPDSEAQLGQTAPAESPTDERGTAERSEPSTPDSRTDAGAPSLTVRLELPTRTILQVLMVVAAIWLFDRLWGLLLLLLLALLLAAALDPLVTRMERRGWSRGPAVGLITVVSVVVIGLLVAVIVRSVNEQGHRLIDNLPDYIDQLEARLKRYPQLQAWVQNARSAGTFDSKSVVRGVVSLGGGVASEIASVLFLLTATLYLLLDGPRMFTALSARLSPMNQARAERIRREVSRVVGGYMRGQLITSALFGAFSYVTLSVAGVPEPLALAMLAAVFDALPLVGATLATIPAVLLALTVSVPTAIVVLVLYIAYQQLENYFITPRVYHGTLDIPDLGILTAATIGGTLFGIAGALLALPIAAAIPAIVRTWPDPPTHS